MLAFAGLKSIGRRNVRLASTVVGSTIDALKAYPYKNAMKFREEDVHMNYTTLLTKARHVANGLYELGMKPGESFLSWTDNRSEALVSFYACALTGIRFVSVDPKLGEADALYDVLKEVQPSTILYNPSGTKVNRASILGELIPEIVNADCGMMQEPLHNRTFDKLRTVVSTEWDQPQYHGVLNFRALVVEQYFPDLVGEMSRRLQEESETILLRSYAYSEGKLWKSKDLSQKQLSEYGNRLANKLNLTPDSIVGLDLPMFEPLSLISALACLQTNAMFFVPQSIPTLNSTKEMTVKENVSHLITEKTHAEQLQQNPPETLKMALYPTECCVCKPMTGLKTVSF